MRSALIIGLVLLVGCQDKTPEQKAKQDAAFAAQREAADKLAKVESVFNAHVKEYNEIKAMIDAGQDIPAVLVTKFDKLKGLITEDYALFKEAKASFDNAKKTYDEATAAGLAWYDKIDWWTVGKVAAGIAVGVAGVYFPVAAPAVRAAQACITAVSAVNAKDPSAGQLVKDAVLDASRALKVEAKVDALVQRFDPPAQA